MPNDAGSKTSVIFFGTPEFAVPALSALYDAGYEIKAVVTAPDKPVGKKQIITSSPIKQFTLEHGLNILHPESLKNSPGLVSGLMSFVADVGIVVAYNKIIPKEIIDIFPRGILNIHPSLLPKYRGPSPIQSAIFAGETETGVTIMKIDEELDHGPTLATTRYSLLATRYCPEIAKELSELGARLLIETLPKYLNGEATPQKQNHSEATYTKKFTRDDGRIDWSKPAEEIYGQIRAMGAEPGVWTTWNGKVLNILKTHPLPFCSIEHGTPGKVEMLDKEVVVQTGIVDAKTNQSAACRLVLDKIQLEGKKRMSAKEFVNGYKDFVGSKLEYSA